MDSSSSGMEQDRADLERADLERADLERALERARTAFDLARMGVWSWDLNTDLFTTHSERGVFGLRPLRNSSREDVLSRIHPDDRASLFTRAEAGLTSRSEFSVEAKVITPEGRTGWVAFTGTVRRDETDTPVRVDGISVDITERKQAELRLRESEARFRTIFEHAGIGISLVRTDGVLVAVNPALEQLLGYSATELEGMHFRDFTHPDYVNTNSASFQELVDGCLDRYEVEKRYIRKDGEVIWGRLVVSAIRDAASKVVFGIGMVEDVTQRKRAEQELLSLSNKMIFAQEHHRSRIARELHDGLGQQIAALSISVANLKRQIPEHVKVAREEMSRLQDRITAIAEGVRRISHQLHPAVLELAGIVAALRSCCQQFSSDAGIAVTLEAPESIDNLPPDVALCLYRIAQEALQNAVKHSGAKEVTVRLEVRDAAVYLTVADRGRGFSIADPSLPWGLGLVSMKERARLLSGTLQLFSVPGKGTTLQVSIPVEADVAASQSA